MVTSARAPGERWRRRGPALLFALVAVVALVDASSDVVLTSYLSIPVLASAVLGRPRLTAGLGAAAVTATVVLTLVRGDPSEVVTWTRLLMIVLICTISVALARYTARTLRSRDEVTAELAASERRFRELSASTSDVVVETDPLGRISWISPASRTLLGFAPEELVGTLAADLLEPSDLGRVAREVGPAIGGRTGSRSAFRVRRRDGRAVWVEAQSDALPDGRVIRLRDISDTVAQVDELVSLAGRDPLTSIANRRGLSDWVVAHAGALARGEVALLLVDVDGLKTVNDTHGHAAGDALLASVAGCLESRLRSQDLVARVGGDEFVVLLDRIVDPRDATAMAERIRTDVQLLTPPAPGAAAPSVSIGVASTGPDLDAALAAADRALYAAKAAGRNTVSTESG